MMPAKSPKEGGMWEGIGNKLRLKVTETKCFEEKRYMVNVAWEDERCLLSFSSSGDILGIATKGDFNFRFNRNFRNFPHLTTVEGPKKVAECGPLEVFCSNFPRIYIRTKKILITVD